MVAKTVGVGILLVFGLLNRAVAAETIDVTKDVKEAQETIAVFKKADPGLSRLFDNAVGYAVFPTVVKGAIGVGGAAGSGVVFEKGKAVGKTSLTQGPSAPSSAVKPSRRSFLRDGAGVHGLQEGDICARRSGGAIAASKGASENVKYQKGVAIFTIGKGGLMVEASVGGQKFSFEPFGKK